MNLLYLFSVLLCVLFDLILILTVSIVAIKSDLSLKRLEVGLVLCIHWLYLSIYLNMANSDSYTLSILGFVLFSSGAALRLLGAILKENDTYNDSEVKELEYTSIGLLALSATSFGVISFFSSSINYMNSLSSVPAVPIYIVCLMLIFDRKFRIQLDKAILNFLFSHR